MLEAFSRCGVPVRKLESIVPMPAAWDSSLRSRMTGVGVDDRGGQFTLILSEMLEPFSLRGVPARKLEGIVPVPAAWGFFAALK
jgi:hypothetical protein